MAEELIFHYREDTNFLSKAQPMIKLIGLLSLCIPLVNASIQGTILILSAVVIASIVIKMPLIRYLRELVFLIIIALLIGISSYFSTNDLILAITSVLKFTTAVYASLLIADSTDPSDLARALGKALNHIPFINGWQIASQIELTLSILPLIFDTTSSIKEARIARGENSLRNPLKSMIGFVYNTMDLLLENIDEMAYALDSRGFDASMERPAIKYHLHDVILLLVIISISIGGKLL
jgi:energy-coupling factor transporter transmembrane protein EcfT